MDLFFELNYSIKMLWWKKNDFFSDQIVQLELFSWFGFEAVQLPSGSRRRIVNVES